MINLVRRSDRRERMLRTLYELELSCQVVAAVDGKYVSRLLPPLLLRPSARSVPVQRALGRDVEKQRRPAGIRPVENSGKGKMQLCPSNRPSCHQK